MPLGRLPAGLALPPTQGFCCSNLPIAVSWRHLCPCHHRSGQHLCPVVITVPVPVTVTDPTAVTGPAASSSLFPSPPPPQSPSPPLSLSPSLSPSQYCCPFHHSCPLSLHHSHPCSHPNLSTIIICLHHHPCSIIAPLTLCPHPYPCPHSHPCSYHHLCSHSQHSLSLSPSSLIILVYPPPSPSPSPSLYPSLSLLLISISIPFPIPCHHLCFPSPSLPLFSPCLSVPVPISVSPSRTKRGWGGYPQPPPGASTRSGTQVAGLSIPRILLLAPALPSGASFKSLQMPPLPTSVGKK